MLAKKKRKKRIVLIASASIMQKSLLSLIKQVTCLACKSTEGMKETKDAWQLHYRETRASA